MSRGKYILKILEDQQKASVTKPETNHNQSVSPLRSLENNESVNIDTNLKRLSFFETCNPSTSKNDAVFKKDLTVPDTSRITSIARDEYSFPLSHNDFGYEDISGSEYITESESSDDSDDELLSNVRSKLSSQSRHNSSQSSSALINIVCLYQLLILNGSFKVIDHKFPEVRHSYLDSDRNFGRIEKKLRKVENIYVPEQYRELIKSASTKNCAILDMENYFYNFDELSGKLNIWNKKSNALGQKVSFKDSVKWIRVDEFGTYLYKENFDEYSPFHKVDLLKKESRVLCKEDNISVRRITEKRGGLTAEKLSNLHEQLKFVKEEYKWFYEKIFENNEDNPKKKEKPIRLIT